MRPLGKGSVSDEVAGQQALGFAVEYVANRLNYCEDGSKGYVSSDSLIRTLIFWPSTMENMTLFSRLLFPFIKQAH